MTFSEKLSSVMELAGTTNSKLAKALCVDASLVCRWRKGTRSPLNNHDILLALSGYLAGRLIMTHQAEALHRLTGIAPREDLPCEELLLLWLRGGEYYSLIGGREGEALEEPVQMLNRELTLSFNGALTRSLQSLLGDSRREMKFGTSLDDGPFGLSCKALFVADNKGVAQSVNGACEDLWGLRPGDMLGRSVFDMERDGSFYPSITRLVLERGRRVCAIQTTKTRQNVLVMGTPLFDAKGEIVNVMNLTCELTDIEWRA